VNLGASGSDMGLAIPNQFCRRPVAPPTAVALFSPCACVWLEVRMCLLTAATDVFHRLIRVGIALVKGLSPRSLVDDELLHAQTAPVRAMMLGSISLTMLRFQTRPRGNGAWVSNH
jgi:hypothetical protein